MGSPRGRAPPASARPPSCRHRQRGHGPRAPGELTVPCRERVLSFARAQPKPWARPRRADRGRTAQQAAAPGNARSQFQRCASGKRQETKKTSSGSEVRREGPAGLRLWFLFLPACGPLPPMSQESKQTRVQVRAAPAHLCPRRAWRTGHSAFERSLPVLTNHSVLPREASPSPRAGWAVRVPQASPGHQPQTSSVSFTVRQRKGTLAAERRAGRPEQKVPVTLFHKGWARAGREPATAAQNSEPAGWEPGKEKDPEPSFYLETRCKFS